MTSWYILTPIPGTRDYAKAKRAGGLDPDLSLYDANRSVWDHPHLSRKELEDLMYHCYNVFYSAVATIRNCFTRRTLHTVTDALLRVGISAFYRYCSMRRMPPMSGGFGRVDLDCEDDYRELRRQTFSVDRYPLPENRLLSARDMEMNRLVNPATLAAMREARAMVGR